MQKNNPTFKRSTLLLALAAVFTFAAVLVPIVRADQFEEKINQLRSDNERKEESRQQLTIEASSLEATIKALQAQINALEAQIRKNEAKSDQLKLEIKAAEEELARQRNLLGKNIRAMYLEGEISMLIMLASSKNISEFVDKQQYHSSVKNKIKAALDRVNELKQALDEQHIALERLIRDQESMQNQLARQRAEQDRLLNLNQQQRETIDNQIKSNYGRIAELRRQQAIANARFIGSAGRGVNCGGGYPGTAPGPWGEWGCNYSLDHSVDTWGMFNRQCVSYTAFKVANSGRNMPKWGLMYRSNATDWPGLARQDRIPVNSTPRPGSVAISHGGFYGHAMYVEHDYGDGTILISQYNAGWDGRYSTARISSAGLEYIHFP